MNKNNRNKIINYTFDSKEEEYFYHWLCELYDNNYIDWIYPQRKTYQIVNPVLGYRVKELKTKEVKELFILSKERNYTPDFIFKFNKKAYKLLFHDSKGGYSNRPFFYCNNNRGIIYVDIKGEFGGKLTSSITFPDRQSVMCSRFNVYVQKVIPFANNINKATLFKETFTPQHMINKEVYSKTNLDRKTGKIKWKKGDSKLKYKVIKINKFLC